MPANYADVLVASSLPQKEDLIALIRPAIFLRSAARPSYDLPIGRSRLGGLPDLPFDIAWPNWRGRPQSFVAQIDLTELPVVPGRELLPPDGRLFFFYDAEQVATGREGFAVFHSTAPVSPVYPDQAPTMLSSESRFKPVRLSFAAGTSVPDAEHPLLEHMGLSFDECLDYGQVIAEIRPAIQGKEPWHQMLGYPIPMQMSVESFCPRDADEESDPEGVAWELLLQVDYDVAASMTWPGDGRLYYMIRREDLRQRRFDRTCIVLQSP